MTVVRTTISAIELVITDVDGVLTDGKLSYWGSREEHMVFDVRDGVAVQMMQAVGIKVAAVTGRANSTIDERLSDMQLDWYQMAVRNKAAAVLQCCTKLGIETAKTAFIGDDFSDLPAFNVCGMVMAPLDATSSVQMWPHIKILNAAGGEGVLQQLFEQILIARQLTALDLAKKAYG